MNIIRRNKKIICFPLLLMMLLFSTNAFAWFFIPSAVRAIVQTFVAAGPMVISNGRAVIPGVNGRALNVSFQASTTIAATALAALASSLNFQDSQVSGTTTFTADGSTITASSGVEACQIRYSTSTTVTCTETVGREGDSCYATAMINGSPYSYIGPTNSTTCTSDLAPQTVLAVDAMYDDFAADPSQTKTDSLVQAIKDNDSTNPDLIDNQVTVEGSASVADGTFSGSDNSDNTITSDGVGGFYVNGVPFTTNPVTDSAGSPHQVTLDSNGEPLIDDSPLTPGVSDPTADPVAPTGTASATGDDLGAVVNSVNAHKAQNKADAATQKTSLDAIKSSTDSVKTSTDSVKSAINELQASNESDKTDPAQAQSMLDQITAARASVGEDSSWLDGLFDKFFNVLPTDGMLAELTGENMLGKLPASDGTCVAIQFDMFGGSLNLDPCPVVEIAVPIFNWLFLALSGIAGLMVWLNPRQEAA